MKILLLMSVSFFAAIIITKNQAQEPHYTVGHNCFEFPDDKFTRLIEPKSNQCLTIKTEALKAVIEMRPAAMYVLKDYEGGE